MQVNSNFVLDVLIVEDDFSFALDLQMLIEKLGYQSIGMIDSAEKALELINRKEPDVILMDIDLKGQMNGLELAETIQQKKIPILFITSYKDEVTYERAKKLSMIGFLVKPLNELTLLTAIDACLRDIPQSNENKTINLLNDSLLIKKGRLYHKVKLKDIYSVESELEYATIFTSGDKFVMRESLKNLMILLADYSFFKSHQSHIINLAYLKSIDMEDSVAIMHNGSHVPISRRNRKLLEEKWTKAGMNI